MSEHLFVYGTLQAELAPPQLAPLMQSLKRLGRGYVRGTLYDLGEYPGIVLDCTGGQVWGQVYGVSENSELLARLDEYEGFSPMNQDSLFVRVRTTVVLDGSRELEASIYVYNRDLGPAPVISSGDFARTHRRK